MSYNISSKEFGHPLLESILKKLTAYFSNRAINFYLIGATARDIVLNIHGEKSGRATRDLDIAVAIANWDEYKIIEEGIQQIEGFTKDKNQKQRFIYEGIYPLDIVPFGDIMNLDYKIFWPPDEQTAMSVIGFPEVWKSTQEIIVDENLTLNVASLAGIFLLKIVAWNDRHLGNNKDADDLGFILGNYLSINQDRVVLNHVELYDDTDFAITTAGARLIGRDMAVILKDNQSTKNKIVDIINNELQKEEDSKLINQILETNRMFKYEETKKCLKNITMGLNEGQMK
jgi:predicted nucleotidyltransferase